MTLDIGHQKIVSFAHNCCNVVIEITKMCYKDVNKQTNSHRFSPKTKSQQKLSFNFRARLPIDQSSVGVVGETLGIEGD